MLIHSISKKNERKRDSLARLPRVTHTHIYTLVADREKKNDLILARCTCVCVCLQSIFSVPSGVMRKEQKANLDCSIQLKLVVRRILLE